ncbi:MAG TPA: glycosyl transferase [Syntrophaceae bacterium]|nr:glycosyl transferase [Syntrophaceae bacterium]
MIEYEENPDGINRAEIVVGIPSFNEASSIGYPTKQAGEGLVKFFGNKLSVIINCDNCSTDNTKDAFLETPTPVPKIYISTPPGVHGKGINFRNLFYKACELKAEAIIVVDADLKSITPQWIQRLGEPLLRDFDYVIPLYVRHKYDGTITNNIAYPLTRALYGRRVRQPIGGEFGFSGKLSETFLKDGFWDESVSHFGIDIWMTTIAINKAASICQSFMDRPKIHRTKDPGLQLGPMFREVTGTIFSLMITFADIWKEVRWSKPTAIFGFGLGEVERPPSVTIDEENLFKKFMKGFNSCKETWPTIIDENNYGKLLEIRDIDYNHFDFPTHLWARILFDFAIAFKNRPSDRTLILDALIPLYLAKTLCFVKKSRRMSIRQVEEFIENECMVFEETKPYLLQRW